MATQTPKINLQKPTPNVEVDWAFRLNETIDTLDDAMLTANVSGVGSITVTDDGSGNVTISGEAAGDGGGGSNALVGSDGITVTSGDPTDDIAGFRGEFVNASGTLQADIDTNVTNIATNVSDIADNTTLITTTSGHLQSEIDAVEAGDVDDVNSVTGSVVIAGAGEVVISTAGQTITVSGTPHPADQDTISNALVGSDGITVTSGSNEDTISGFRTEFVAASGALSTEIDSDISTHAAITDAHHTKYTDAEAVTTLEPTTSALAASGVATDAAVADNTTLITTTSGHLQSEIDAVESSDVDSVNAVTGAVLVTGTQNVTTQTAGQTITVTGPDLSSFATSSEVDADVAAVSGTLSSEIDSDISTHTADSSAHHAKYLDSEAIAATESARFTVSGTLSSEIDSDIATHTADASAHHTRYTDSEAISALEPTTSELAASGVAIDANIVSVSGHLQSEIDAVEESDVDSVNAVTGAVLVTGTNGVNSSTVGQTITLSAVDSEIDHGSIGGLGDDDHPQYSLVDGTRAFTGTVGGVTPAADTDLTTRLFVTAISGHLTTEIDTDISTHAAISDAHHTKYTDSEAVSATESARFTMSGTLSSEIDSDISTHASDNDAHHTKYTDGEAVTATESARFTMSGTLSTEIDSDISTHTAISDAHHSRYTKDENDAITGSDGITIVSGSDTIDVGGFRTEFVNASGSLQTQIDAVESSDVDSVNAQTGAITITGTTGVNTSTAGGVITLTSEDSEIDHDALLNFLSAEHFTEASIDHTNILNVGSNTHAQIDTHIADTSIHFEESALTGSDGITIASGSGSVDVAGFHTEFVAASGALSAEIDSDISTHAAITNAHHTKYTDAEAVTATESARFTVSGTLSSEIDSDISTHAGITDAHHTKYTDAEAVTALEPTTSALAASGVATDAQVVTNRTEFVNASGTLQTQIDGIDSSVTLQEAYDNGDGTISTTAGKPLELTNTGELTAVTGTFTDGLSVEGEIIKEAIYNSKKTFSYNPSTTSTLYTQFLGTFHTEGGPVEIVITEEGASHGASSFFRITRRIARTPIIALQHDGSFVADYKIHYRELGSENYELFFENNSNTDATITHVAFINYYTSFISDTVSAENDTDVFQLTAAIATTWDGDTEVGDLSVTGTINIPNVPSGATPSIGRGTAGLQFATNSKINFIHNGVIEGSASSTFLVHQRIQAQQSSVASPSFGRVTDDDTGIHLPTGNLLSLVAGATERLTVSGVGNSTDGVGVDGNLTVIGDITVSGTIFTPEPTATNDVVIGRSSAIGFGFNEAGTIRFIIGGTNTGFINAGSLGYPRFKALGSTVGSPAFAHNSDPNTGLHLPLDDSLSLVTGGIERLTISGVGDSTDGVGIDGNLTVTGTITTNKVGIGIDSPSQALHVRSSSGGVTFDATTNNRQIVFNPSAGSIDSQNSAFHINRSSGLDVAIGFSSTSFLRIGQSTPFDAPSLLYLGNTVASDLVFVLDGASSQTADLLQLRSNGATSGADIFVVEAGGNVGIGITTPAAKLDVVGDIAASGTILTKPITDVGLNDISIGASDSSIGFGFRSNSTIAAVIAGTQVFNISPTNVFGSRFASIDDGSPGFPGFRSNDDQDTGMYFPADDVLAFTAGGTKRVTISGVNDSTDGVGVDGNLTVTGTIEGDIGTFATGLTVSGISVRLTDSVGIENVVEDLTPQLGGDLDVNGKSITSAGNADVEIQPAGTGGIGLFTGKVNVNPGNQEIRLTTSGGGRILIDTTSNSNTGDIFIQAGGDLLVQTDNSGLLQIDSDGFLDITAENRVKIVSSTQDIRLEAAVEVSSTAPLRFDASSDAASPAYSFLGDTGIGMYRIASNRLGLSAGGTETLTVSGVNDSTDGVGVEGNLTVTGTVAADTLSTINAVNVGTDLVGGTGKTFFGTDGGDFSFPGVTWVDDTDTGIWKQGPNFFTFVTGGSSIMEIRSSFIFSRKVHFFKSGSAAAPLLAFLSDSTTGLFQNSAGDGSLAFATVGTRAGYFDNAQTFHVTNDIRAEGTISGTSGILETLTLSNLPTSSGALNPGELWVDVAADHTLKVTP